MDSAGFRSMDEMLRMDFDSFRSEVSGPNSTAMRSLPGPGNSTRHSVGPTTVERTVTSHPVAPNDSWNFTGPPGGLGHGLHPGGFSVGLMGALLGRHMTAAGQHGGGLSYEQMLQLDRNNARRGVKPAAIRRLRRGKATSQEAPQKCQVCLNQLGNARSVVRLPCSHPFCEDCIGEWLRLNHTCPVCRWEFPEADTQIVGN